jgi:hypothetical protein
MYGQRRFGGVYYIYLQGSIIDSYTPKLEEADSSKIFVHIYQTTRPRIAKDFNLEFYYYSAVCWDRTKVPYREYQQIAFRELYLNALYCIIKCS